MQNSSNPHAANDKYRICIVSYWIVTLFITFEKRNKEILNYKKLCVPHKIVII